MTILDETESKSQRHVAYLKEVTDDRPMTQSQA